MSEFKEMLGSFRQKIKLDLNNFLEEQNNKYPGHDLLKIDLHCHDYNSDVPDELLGRILNVPETWLKTERLIKELQRNQCDLITITNHNNARSCFEQIEKGREILVGAEFSCTVPDFGIGIHVLAYGFTKEQEQVLNKLRKNVYHFQAFALKENIPTIWAHPLYHYSPHGIPTIDFFDKMALIFERFEVLNGQRDSWQSLLVKDWLDNLSPEKIDSHAAKFEINPLEYCKNPYRKVYTGGSDSHIGLFAGLTGSYLYIPDLESKLLSHSKTELAMDALRDGRIIPYGSYTGSDKLSIALLDYVFQVAIHRQDPGMFRIMLHRGSLQEKLTALFISNGFAEVQRHDTTMQFIKLFHNCFLGKVPSFTKKWLVPKAYKSIFDDAIHIAEASRDSSPDSVSIYNNSILQINQKLNKILFSRLNRKIVAMKKEKRLKEIDFNQIISQFEIPSEFRSLINPDKRKAGKKSVALICLNFSTGFLFHF
jgi:hypothetical protein